MTAKAAIASGARRQERLLWRLCALAVGALLSGEARAQAHTSWSAEARLGSRVRSPTGSDGVVLCTEGSAPQGCSPVAVDVEVAPRLGGTVAGGGWDFSVGYGATLRARQPHVRFAPDHHHVGALQLGWRREGRARPFLFVHGSYGLEDLGNRTAQPTGQPGAQQAAPQAEPREGEAPAPQAEAPPAAPTLALDRFLSLFSYGVDGALGVEVPLSPRVSWTTTAGFFHGGGADDPSRARLPVQNAPRLSTRVDLQASRLDGLGAAAEARAVWFSSGQQAREGELWLQWRRQLGPTSSLDLRAGAGVVWNLTAPVALAPPRYALSPMGEALSSVSRWRFFPAGQVAFNHRFDLRTWWGLALWASTGVAPYVDRFTAFAYPRADAQGGFTATVRDWLTLRFGGGLALPLGAETARGLVTTYLDGALLIHPQRWWRVDLTSVVNGSQWVIGLGLTVVGTGDL